MPKGSEELVNYRKEEILNACEILYKTMNFKDITIKEIGNITSFTRTSIYNYFETKEEIFLMLLKREYDKWILELNKVVSNNDELSFDEFYCSLANTLVNRELLLKILSLNLSDLEENSRQEMLVELKKSYGNAINAVDKCLIKFHPKMTKEERQDFLFMFFPFIYGIYPYAKVRDKQRDAMTVAQVNFIYHSIYELVYSFLSKTLKENDAK